VSKRAEIAKAHCNTCLTETKHEVVARRTKEYVDFSQDGAQVVFHAKDTFEMLQCCGCEGIALKRHYKGDDDPEGSTEYYPPRVSRREPEWMKGLALWWQASDLQFLLREIYAALHSGSTRLAMMGARAVVDLVMLHKIDDIGGFGEKLDKFEAEGLVGRKDRKVLEAALDAGHAAVHRGHCPDAKQVNQVMDIVEHLVQSVYVLGEEAEELRKSVPARPKRKP
jgi:hypothetical protein